MAWVNAGTIPLKRRRKSAAGQLEYWHEQESYLELSIVLVRRLLLRLCRVKPEQDYHRCLLVPRSFTEIEHAALRG